MRDDRARPGLRVVVLAAALLALAIATPPALSAAAGVGASVGASPLSAAAAGDTAAAASTPRSPAAIEAEVRQALARGDISRLLELADEAATWPPGSQSKLLEGLGAAGDLRAGRLSLALERLQRLGPLAIGAFALAALASALILSAMIYLPCAMVAVMAGARRIGIELPRALTAPGVDPTPRTRFGTPAEWRSPLGLRAGLALYMADDAFGFAAALAVAWWLRSPVDVLSFDLVSHAGAISALVGTAAGNLGAAGLAFLLYRWRGAGARAAGLVPLPVVQVLALAATTAVPLVFLSMIHEVAFFHFVGREPQSNMQPILEALLIPGASPAIFVFLALTVVVTGPIAEEVVYRGLLYRAFRDRTGVPVALLLSGFLFAITHLEVDHLLALWLIGVAFAWVTERSGSLIPAMAAHGLYNGLTLGLYFLSRAGR